LIRKETQIVLKTIIMESALADHLAKATRVIEEQVDAEIEKIDKMGEDDFETLREKRLQALKKQATKKQEWAALGHGKYEELKEEPEFFKAGQQSKRMVCHFYRDDFFRCKIVDKHMALLAQKHQETRFCKINAEKSKFLVDRLNIKTLPTICLVRDTKTVDYIVGFTDLGNTDEFSTEMLEWRIAHADCIHYNGDLLTPPTQTSTKKKPSILGTEKKKTIRGRENDDSSDDDY